MLVPGLAIHEKLVRGFVAPSPLIQVHSRFRWMLGDPEQLPLTNASTSRGERRPTRPSQPLSMSDGASGDIISSIAPVPIATKPSEEDSLITDHTAQQPVTPEPLAQVLIPPTINPRLILLISLSLKLLLFPSAFSTDFEVHRHWKSLTHTLPLSRWYFDASSPWTLDYPPLFAYFELFLSRVAAVLHPALLSLDAVEGVDPRTVAFMRATVLLAEPLLLLGSVQLAGALAGKEKSNGKALAAALVLLSPGLTLVDNVHFQYNGLPLSVLLLSVALFLQQQTVAGAIAFSAALNLKHTLLPLAPAFAVHILASSYTSSKTSVQFLRTLFAVGVATISTFAVLWGPLYVAGGATLLRQVIARMFPFGRGLLHAYWAPNFWALYAFVDKVLIWLGLGVRAVDVDPASGHIGGVAPFAALPNPNPALCASLLLALLVPALLRLTSRPRRLVIAVVYSALAAFVVGWHVHEKAVLVPLLPLAVLAAVSGEARVREAFLWLSLAGQYSLFPLVTDGAASVYKIAHFVAYHAFAVGMLLRGKWCWRYSVLVAYATGIVVVEVYAGVGDAHRVLWGERLQFLPLMLVSVYCTAGVVVAFCLLMALAVHDERDDGT